MQTKLLVMLFGMGFSMYFTYGPPLKMLARKSYHKSLQEQCAKQSHKDLCLNAGALVYEKCQSFVHIVSLATEFKKCLKSYNQAFAGCLQEHPIDTCFTQIQQLDLYAQTKSKTP